MDLSALLSPKSVAVIGASRDATKVGAIIYKNIIDSGFPGKVYPVSPNMDYHTVLDLPEVVDLAVIAIPASAVLVVLEQIGQKGIKNVVVLTAGFKENGSEGEVLEKQLIEVANKYNINLIGPNCLGFINNLCPINATFGQQSKLPGRLRFISQSGALATGIFDWAQATGVGFDQFITLGNKAVINENHFLEQYLKESQNTAEIMPIGLYLESVSDGKKFLELTTALSRKNPIFVIKPGKSEAAVRAMKSHTGAIAGADAIFDTALTQAGVIRCEELEDFFDLARSFAWEDAPYGPRVAVISNAGGPAVISTDAIAKYGLTLAEIGRKNPVDVLGDALADKYLAAAEEALGTEQTDALVCILTPQLMTQIEKTAELIGGLAKKYQKPIFCSFIGGSLVAEGEKVLNTLKIPSFRYPERAIKALGTMWKWRQFKDRQVEVMACSQPTYQFTIDRTIFQQNFKTLDSLDANKLLVSAGINTPLTVGVNTLDEAKKFGNYPVVLKLSSPGLLHKTEIGGVITNIKDSNELEVAWDKLERKIEQLDPEIREHLHLQVQKEVESGVEVIVGVKRDPNFGLCLLFGAGGTLAELVSDRNLHLLPVNYASASSLVINSKIFPLLKGYRGQPTLAVTKLYDLLVRLGKLAEDLPEVDEIEINPVIVTLNDVWAVDGKVVLKEGEAKPVSAPKFKIATAMSADVLANKFHYFVFETPELFTFLPGQYVSVKVADQRINAYSIASKIDDTHFSLLVDTSPGGVGSKYFDNVKVGDKISFLGPFGTFTYKPNDGAKQLVFLGTGSGCSALRCMIETALKETKLPVTLYWGLRFPSDVFWQDCFAKLAAEHPNFNFQTVLSKPDPNWHGPIGHVTDLVMANFHNTSDCAFYLCGNKPMITEATEILVSSGCSKERIYSEKFF